MIDIKQKEKNHISLCCKHRYKDIYIYIYCSLDYIFDDYSKSKSIASLNQYIGPVYDNLGYDEDFHLHCLEPTQHNIVGY